MAGTLACLGLAAFWIRRSSGGSPESPPGSQLPAGPTNAAAPAATPAEAGDLPAPAVSPATGPSISVAAPATAAAAASADAPGSGESGRLVASLAGLNLARVPLTPEQAAGWKRSLQSLIQQGPAAVPALREFLARNTDATFGPETASALGYDSVRAALVDALAQIGGPEATTALLQTLQTTTDPSELAVLAQNLDKLGPEQFRDQAVQSARQLLEAAATKPGFLSDKDVAPLFEVLDKYGGAGAAADLVRSSARWGYYSAIALAQLPDGAGVASLVTLAQPPDGVATTAQDPALRALAQLAPSSPTALDALLQLARQNQIIPVTWAGIAPILAGDQLGFQYSAFDGTATPDNRTNLKTTHISLGNQSFYSAPGPTDLTADQIAQRFEVIQKLLAATSDPAGQRALSDASGWLAAHLPPASGNPPGK